MSFYSKLLALSGLDMECPTPDHSILYISHTYSSYPDDYLSQLKILLPAPAFLTKFMTSSLAHCLLCIVSYN